jgi:hypothetical protein
MFIELLYLSLFCGKQNCAFLQHETQGSRGIRNSVTAGAWRGDWGLLWGLPVEPVRAGGRSAEQRHP